MKSMENPMKSMDDKIKMDGKHFHLDVLNMFKTYGLQWKKDGWLKIDAPSGAPAFWQIALHVSVEQMGKSPWTCGHNLSMSVALQVVDHVRPSSTKILLQNGSNNSWWLSHPSEKYEFVSWDDEIPKEKLEKHVPNRQPDSYSLVTG